MEQFFTKLKAFWDKGVIQSASRVTYDIVANLVLFIVVIAMMLGLFGAGVGAGYFASLVKDEPIRSYEDMRNDIYNYEETSRIYFAGNKLIGEIRSELHRDEVKLENVSDLVIQAVVATEDQEFYEHNGIVPKAIIRATLQEFTNSAVQSGGSTLTQQIIKNQILTNEVSFDRKAKEILLAMRLENFFEKEEILEAYLNVIPYGRNAAGRNIAGIQTAAKGIFGVDASELTLPQAAYLSGIPQNPYTFTPFKQSGELKDEEQLQYGIDRMHTVLRRMYQMEFITEKEYKDALAYDITEDFTTRKSIPMDRYPAIVNETVKQAEDILKEHLANEDGYILDDLLADETLNEEYTILANRALRMNGYEIHTTINKKMYDKMQKIVKDYPYFGPDRTFTEDVDGESVEVKEQEENGMVLIENNTGKILSFVPGRSNSLKNQLNYAIDTQRSPGSTWKPIGAVAPGMELGYIQPGTVVADVKTKFPGYSKPPSNITNQTYGLVSAREVLSKSYNISTLALYQRYINQEDIYERFIEKQNFSKVTYEDTRNSSFPLGTVLVSVLENTAAFAVFSNGGQYVEPYIIEKITTNDGEVIYEHEVEPVDIYSPQTAYLAYDMLRDTIGSGTAMYLKTQLKSGGVDWAGKTGTSQKYEDAWFVGTNPNVTLASWIGYKTPSSVECRGCSLTYHQRNMKLWATVVNELSEIDADLITPSERNKQPEGIVSRSYCQISGLLPSDLCSKLGLVSSDIYNAKFVPQKADNSLVGGDMPLVEVDGESMIAGPKTPSEFVTDKKGGYTFSNDFIKQFLEDDRYSLVNGLSDLIPRNNRDKWNKISFEGSAVINPKNVTGNLGTPSAPTSLKADGNNVSWNAKKGEMVVGYRIYHAPAKGKKFSLLNHTRKTSFTIPKTPGIYHIRAVNYDGTESEPSKQIIVEDKDKDKGKDKDKDKENDKSKDKDKKPDIDKDKNNNNSGNNQNTNNNNNNND